MPTLEELKDFARIDTHDDDALVTGLGIAAYEYVTQATGKTFIDPMPERAKLAIMALVAHWYEYREPVIASAVTSVPMHVKSLIAQLRAGVLEPEPIDEP